MEDKTRLDDQSLSLKEKMLMVPHDSPVRQQTEWLNQRYVCRSMRLTELRDRY